MNSIHIGLIEACNAVKYDKEALHLGKEVARLLGWHPRGLVIVGMAQSRHGDFAKVRFLSNTLFDSIVGQRSI